MNLHRNYIIRGKVQGVFFRASAKSKADDLSLTGIVKNMDDGSVYLEAEGDDSKLNDLENWLKQGPQFARVYEVISSDGELRDYKTFEITY